MAVTDALQLSVGYEQVLSGSDALKKLVDDAKRAQRGATDLRKETKGLTDGMASLARIAKVAGASLVGALGIRALQAAADGWAQMSNRIGVAIGNMDAAAVTMERMLEISRSSFTTIKASVDAYTQAVGTFADMGRSAGEAADFVESLNLHLVAGYVEGERATVVQNALSKAMAIGTLNARGLETVIGNSAEVSRALADELGVTVSELRGMAAQGKITGDVIADALGKRLTDIRKQVDAMPWTMGGAMTAIAREFQVLIARANEAVGATSTLAKGMSGLAQAMASITAEQVGAAIRIATDAAVAFMGVIAGAAIGRAIVAMRTLAASVTMTSLAYKAGAAYARAYHTAMAAVGGPIGLAVIGATTLATRFALAYRRAQELNQAVASLGDSLTNFRRLADAFRLDPTGAGNAESVATAAEAESKRLRVILDELFDKRRRLAQQYSLLMQQGNELGSQRAAEGLRLIQEQIARVERELLGVELAGSAAEAALVRMSQAAEDARKAMRGMSEEQEKIYLAAMDGTIAMSRRYQLAMAELQHGKDSLQVALMRNEQERKAELHKIAQARAQAEGNRELELALDMQTQATNRLYDAQHATIIWADNMERVRATLSGIASILGQIGGGMIQNADTATQIRLIREGVEPARARIQVQREAQMRELDAQAMGANWGERLLIGAQKAVLEHGFKLEDELAQVTENALKKSAGGSKGGGGRAAAAKAAGAQAKAINDVVANLRDEISMVGLSDQARRLHMELQRAGVDLYSQEGQQIADMVERLHEAQSAYEAQAEAARNAGEWNKRFLDGIMHGRKGLSDFIKQLAQMQIQLALLGKDGTGGLLGPLFSGLLGGIIPSFDGGGYTGSGSRTGGIDGRGGFPAVLHPGETVIDHTKGQGAGAVDVRVYVDQDGNWQAAVERIAGPVSAQVVAGYDKALPGRFQQISANPRYR